jgi:hypothetical protein
MANTLIENPMKYFTELLDGEIGKAMADTTNKKKWKRAIEENFPDSAPANIVMTGGEKLDLIPKCPTCGDRDMGYTGISSAVDEPTLKYTWKCDYCSTTSATAYSKKDVATSPTLRRELERIRESTTAREAALQEKLRAMAAQQNGAMRQYQPRVMGQYEPTATEIAGIAAAQQGVTSFAARMELGWLGEPTLTPDLPKKRPAKPEKTTEEAQEELTGIGKRKIICDDGENNH